MNHLIFSSFATGFVLFEATFFVNAFYHQNRSVFLKSATSFLLAKFACFNLGAKFSDVNLLNSGVVIYMS